LKKPQDRSAKEIEIREKKERWTWFEDMVGRDNSPTNRTLHFALLPCLSSLIFFFSFSLGFAVFLIALNK